MGSTSNMAKRVVLAGLGCWLLSLGRASAEDPAAFVVVVSPTREVSTLTLVDLQQMYVGRVQSWGDGTRVQPILVQGPPSEAFFEAIGASQAQMDQAWVRLTLQGKGDSPRVVKTSEQALAEVAETAGAIAIVAGDADLTKVKVVTIIPGSSGCQGD